MKSSAVLYPVLRALSPEELTIINGGSFAYDLGTFLRFLGIYYANGMGASGHVAATSDYVYNQYINGQW